MALSYGAQSYGAQPAAAPVLVAFAGPGPQRRATVFFRLIIALPALVVVGIVGIGAFVVAIIGWFGALFTGRLPAFAADFLPGYLRWQARVLAYVSLLTDVYPPFTLENDEAYPVWLTAQPGPLNRAAVFFRIILILPAAVLQTLVQYGVYPVAFVAWLIVLVSGQMPASLFQAFSVVIRYQLRVSGYALMVTSEWPWGLFGDTETVFFGAPPVTGAYGAPPVTGAYGAPPAPGAAGAAPAPVGSSTAPPPPNPASFASTPPPPAAPVPPTLAGVAFTFGGPAYLWGYTDDRSHCGIWSATDLTAPPQMWPIGDQGEGWTRFRELEPNAVALADPTPPPAPAPMAQGGMPAFGAAPPLAVGSPYPTSGSPADDPRWRIVLSSGAKRLVVLFLVLGVIDYGAYLAFVGNGSHPFQVLVANAQVQNAYRSLQTSVTTYRTQTSACQGSASALSCVTSADQTVSEAFGTFVRQMQSISMPASASASATALTTDGTNAQQIFEQLASSNSAAQYQQNYTSSNIAQVLNKFDQDYRNLTDAL
ncbi:MAG TPA: DUF4389 domain-containing protein [Acidimicrobiales bacterium]|nr:DUF4389 domain-containing protein [Acidimicrobiales bacterium]